MEFHTNNSSSNIITSLLYNYLFKNSIKSKKKNVIYENKKKEPYRFFFMVGQMGKVRTLNKKNGLKSIKTIDLQPYIYKINEILATVKAA